MENELHLHTSTWKRQNGVSKDFLRKGKEWYMTTSVSENLMTLCCWGRSQAHQAQGAQRLLTGRGERDYARFGPSKPTGPRASGSTSQPMWGGWCGFRQHTSCCPRRASTPCWWGWNSESRAGPGHRQGMQAQQRASVKHPTGKDGPSQGEGQGPAQAVGAPGLSAGNHPAPPHKATPWKLPQLPLPTVPTTRRVQKNFLDTTAEKNLKPYVCICLMDTEALKGIQCVLGGFTKTDGWGRGWGS